MKPKMSELPANPKKPKVKGEEEANVDCREEEEEVLVALVEHCADEIERLKHHISNYKTKLIEAERSLRDAKAKLAHLRGPVPTITPLRNVSDNEPTRIPKKDFASPSPSKTLKPSHSSDPTSSSSISKAKKSETSRDGLNVKAFGDRDRGTKRKFEQKEHKEFIRLIARNSSPTTIKCHSSNQISSQHKQKLRSLIMCPVNEQLFATRFFSAFKDDSCMCVKPHTEHMIRSAVEAEPKTTDTEAVVVSDNPKRKEVFAVVMVICTKTFLNLNNLFGT